MNSQDTGTKENQPNNTHTEGGVSSDDYEDEINISNMNFVTHKKKKINDVEYCKAYLERRKGNISIIDKKNNDTNEKEQEPLYTSEKLKERLYNIENKEMMDLYTFEKNTNNFLSLKIKEGFDWECLDMINTLRCVFSSVPYVNHLFYNFHFYLTLNILEEVKYGLKDDWTQFSIFRDDFLLPLIDKEIEEEEEELDFSDVSFRSDKTVDLNLLTNCKKSKKKVPDPMEEEKNEEEMKRKLQILQSVVHVSELLESLKTTRGIRYNQVGDSKKMNSADFFFKEIYSWIYKLNQILKKKKNRITHNLFKLQWVSNTNRREPNDLKYDSLSNIFMKRSYLHHMRKEIKKNSLLRHAYFNKQFFDNSSTLKKSSKKVNGLLGDFEEMGELDKARTITSEHNKRTILNLRKPINENYKFRKRFSSKRSKSRKKGKVKIKEYSESGNDIDYGNYNSDHTENEVQLFDSCNEYNTNDSALSDCTNFDVEELSSEDSALDKTDSSDDTSTDRNRTNRKLSKLQIKHFKNNMERFMIEELMRRQATNIKKMKYKKDSFEEKVEDKMKEDIARAKKYLRLSDSETDNTANVSQDKKEKKKKKNFKIHVNLSLQNTIDAAMNRDSGGELIIEEESADEGSPFSTNRRASNKKKNTDHDKKKKYKNYNVRPILKKQKGMNRMFKYLKYLSEEGCIEYFYSSLRNLYNYVYTLYDFLPLYFIQNILMHYDTSYRNINNYYFIPEQNSTPSGVVNSGAAPKKEEPMCEETAEKKIRNSPQTHFSELFFQGKRFKTLEEKHNLWLRLCEAIEEIEKEKESQKMKVETKENKKRNTWKSEEEQHNNNSLDDTMEHVRKVSKGGEVVFEETKKIKVACTNEFQDEVDSVNDARFERNASKSSDSFVSCKSQLNKNSSENIINVEEKLNQTFQNNMKRPKNETLEEMNRNVLKRGSLKKNEEEKEQKKKRKTNVEDGPNTFDEWNKQTKDKLNIKKIFALFYTYLRSNFFIDHKKSCTQLYKTFLKKYIKAVNIYLQMVIYMVFSVFKYNTLTKKYLDYIHLYSDINKYKIFLYILGIHKNFDSVYMFDTLKTVFHPYFYVMYQLYQKLKIDASPPLYSDFHENIDKLAESESLVQLPKNYFTVIKKYRKRTCPICTKPGPSQVVCLFCGVVLCRFPKTKYVQDHEYSSGRICVFDHAQYCNGGQGLFLCLSTSMIFCTDEKRHIYINGPYIDKNGDVDARLVRGRNLYLSKHKMHLVYDMMVNVSNGAEISRWNR